MLPPRAINKDINITQPILSSIQVHGIVSSGRPCANFSLPSKVCHTESYQNTQFLCRKRPLKVEDYKSIYHVRKDSCSSIALNPPVSSRESGVMSYKSQHT